MAPLLILDKQVKFVHFQVDFQKEMHLSVLTSQHSNTDSTNGVSGGNVQVTITYMSNKVHFALLVCQKRIIFMLHF